MGDSAVRAFQHPMRITPDPHIFANHPAIADSRLARPVWAGCHFPPQAIPYTMKYFGESEGEIACFTATAVVRVPEEYRKRARRDVDEPPLAPSPRAKTDQ
jgi:hypothetical protein